MFRFFPLLTFVSLYIYTYIYVYVCTHSSVKSFIALFTVFFTLFHSLSLSPMSRNTPEFNKLADRFTEEYKTERLALEQCLQSRINDDINFVCQQQKSAYLKGIALVFCKKEYDAGVKCQRDAGEEWATACFKENVAFGKCSDTVLKKMYVYNLERNKKNPEAN